MNEDIKKKWVAALRSGEYKQTRGFLRRGNSYCCLGVLCDLYSQEGKGEWKDAQISSLYTHPSSSFYYDPGPDDVPNRTCLPVSIWKDAGLLNTGGRLSPAVVREIYREYKDTHELGTLPRCSNLTWLNDHSFTFPEIADIIEKYL